MKKDLSFVTRVTLCLVMGLVLGACGGKSNNNNNSNTNGTITTANNQPNFDCLTRGINCHTLSNNGFGLGPNFQNGRLCNGCNHNAGYELMAYVQNGVTRYSCVQSNSLQSSNGGIILSWSFSSKGKNRNRRNVRNRRNRRRNGRNRNRLNLNVISNFNGGIGHNFYQNNSAGGLCQQSIAQGCFRDRPCRKYRRNGYRAYCDKGFGQRNRRNNRNVRGVCVFPPQAR